MSIIVSITDDHPLAIAGIKNLLSSDSSIKVEGTYTNAASLKEGLLHNIPDILLLDIHLPDAQGSVLTEELIQLYPSLKIIALTSLDAPSHVKSMMRAGCKGYLLKNTDQQQLLLAIKEVHNGNNFIEPGLKEEMLNNMLQFQKTKTNINPQEAKLSSREKEILLLKAQEMSNREIADKLFLSLRTVQNHCFNLQQKLGAKNTIGLVKIAIQMGLVKS